MVTIIDWDFDGCGVVDAGAHASRWFGEMIKWSGLHFCVLYQDIYTRFTGLSESINRCPILPAIFPSIFQPNSRSTI